MNALSERELTIKGAGIAGLSAAIMLADGGARVTVVEKHSAAGHRCAGDFQGLENWTAEEDALAYLERLGIEPAFWYRPVHDVTFFDAEDTPHRCHTDKPLLYMVRRGSEPGCLDYELQEQARKMGVRFSFNMRSDHKTDIDSTGAKTPIAFAYGVTFRTGAPDIVSAVVDDEIAPKGYSYLICLEGRATLASAFFSRPYTLAKSYYLKTLERYRRLYSFDMREPSYFGRYISFGFMRRNSGVLLGEAAGIQDYLFGFGMRLAIRSAELAVQAATEGVSYRRLYRKEIVPALRAGVVNRLLYERLTNVGYRDYLARMSEADVRELLRKSYSFTPLHRVLYPLARLLRREVGLL